MPSREFVNSCISQSSGEKKSNYIYFSFGLEVGGNLSSFDVYRDLNGAENATRNYLLSLDPLNQIVDINRLSNDSYYNFVLNAFAISANDSIRCFIWKRWDANYREYDNFYFFCYDDFPTKNKGFLTLNFETYLSFLKRFFKNKIWFGNNYVSSERDFYSLTFYTTRYGSSATCSSSYVKSTSNKSNNCACLSLPIGVKYSINNYSNPEDESVYNMNFTDSSTVTYLVYYLTLDYFDNGVCCLAECFGITE